MAYRQSPRSQIMRSDRNLRERLALEAAQNKLNKETTAAKEHIDEKGSLGGLLGGLGGFAAGEIAKKLIMPTLLAAATTATGGVLNPLVIKGLMGAASLASSGLAAKGAKFGTEKMIGDVPTISSDLMGAEAEDANKYLSGYSDMLASEHAMEGLKYAGLLSGAMGIGKSMMGGASAEMGLGQSLTDKLGTATQATESIGEDILSKVVDPIMSEGGQVNKLGNKMGILDIMKTVSQTDRLANIPEQAAGKFVSNVGSGVLPAENLSKNIGIFDKGLPQLGAESLSSGVKKVGKSSLELLTKVNTIS